MRPDRNRLLQLLDGRTVAVIGNAPLERDYSAEIDSADVVIRFNHFYNFGSGRAGRKVSIVFQTFTTAWMTAADRNIEAVLKQKPEVFVVKKPEQYTPAAHQIYGDSIRINNYTALFKQWDAFTTGGAALCYLANYATKSSFRVFGFPNDERWTHYLETDAKHYKPIAENERRVVDEAIAKLVTFSADDSAKPIPRKVVIPVKRTSLGLPGKNRALLFPLLDKLAPTGLDIEVVGDDSALIASAAANYSVTPFFTRPIGSLQDVTVTLREWRDATGWCGDTAIVQCTSPDLRPEWIVECFDALSSAPITATATELSFKPTAIYRQAEGGVYLQLAPTLGSTSAPRQTLPPCVRVNGAVAAFHSDALDNDSMWNCGALKPIIVDEWLSRDIDTASDLEPATKPDKINASGI